ncbi:MAG: class I SAM-dependent methyltransferase [Desulfobacterales bacterium]|nr:class I SAM-dependent methyltransferase [Desulfobacterales bacterium]
MKLTAKMEPFDSFWEAPEDIEKGFISFYKFYKRNYFKYIPGNKSTDILVISCGPGYFVNLLNAEGYKNVMGIDSDPEKVKHAKEKGLNCIAARGFEYLNDREDLFDVIIAEQEINHLTKDEILLFLKLCKERLTRGGVLIVHSLNGANPVTGSEALAQNFDHYNTFTENSLRQILEYSNFRQIKVFPLKLYIFYENPINYVGLALEIILAVIFKISFIFYGKKNQLFSKKIAAIAIR